MRPGIPSAAARRSLPDVTIAMPRRSRSGFAGVQGHPYEQGFDLRLIPEKLAEPLRWKTPKMIFVNSMSDLFHKDVPDEYVEAVGHVMERANWHTYQVLTKRSSRLRTCSDSLQFAAGLRHIWWA